MQAQISINLLNITNQEQHNLKDAECIIGRGWLNCNDKRISNRHGIIKLKSCSAVDLLSTHDNPIFYKKQSDGILSLLQKGNEIELLIGDLFGLTPDAFWFRIQKSDDETEKTPLNSTNIDTIDPVNNNGTNIQIKAERVSDDESNTVDAETSILVNQPIKPEPMDTSEAANDATHSNGLTNEPQRPIETTVTEIKGERLETDTSPNQNGNNTNGIAGTSNLNSNAQRRGRECCKHGIRCYRRNPIHRAEQAHPGDTDYRLPDYEEPPYGVPSCPYGQRCYRRNPIHFKQFSHACPGFNVQGKKQTKRDRTSDDKTEKPERKKRKPKTNYDNGDVEDEENSSDNDDPYATDEDTNFSLEDEDPSDDPSTDDSDSNNE